MDFDVHELIGKHWAGVVPEEHRGRTPAPPGRAAALPSPPPNAHGAVRPRRHHPATIEKSDPKNGPEVAPEHMNLGRLRLAPAATHALAVVKKRAERVAAAFPASCARPWAELGELGRKLWISSAADALPKPGQRDQVAEGDAHHSHMCYVPGGAEREQPNDGIRRRVEKGVGGQRR